MKIKLLKGWCGMDMYVDTKKSVWLLPFIFLLNSIFLLCWTPLITIFVVMDKIFEVTSK